MTKDPNKTEKLVKRAYDGIVPPHYVAEELADSLPAKRSRPRGPLAAKILWPVAAAAALAILLLKPPAEEPGQDAATALDGSKKVGQPLKARALEVVDIFLDEDGSIRVPSAKEENRWQQVSLNGLGAYLSNTIDVFDAAQRKEGKSGFDDHPSGIKLPRVQIVLHAGRNVPWRHVQWIMMACVEQNCVKLLFMEGENAVDASLPVDRAVAFLDKPKTTYKIQVRIRVQGQDVTYSHPSGRATKDLKVVAGWIEAGAKLQVAKKVVVKGEIKADAQVPYRHVVDLVQLFRRGGLDKIEFFGAALPTPAQRRADRLVSVTGINVGSLDEVRVQDPRQAKIPERLQEEEIIVEEELSEEEIVEVEEEEIVEVEDEEIVEEPIEPKKKEEPVQPK